LAGQPEDPDHSVERRGPEPVERGEVADQTCKELGEALASDEALGSARSVLLGLLQDLSGARVDHRRASVATRAGPT
jgi:hypothetical protein